MKLSRTPAFAIGVLALVLAAQDASAVRYAQRPLLWQRTAVSFYGGGALPVGPFAEEDLNGDGSEGNHAAWPLNWAIELEHFAGPTWSIGFSAAFVDFEDKETPTLHTNLNTYSGFFRIVIPTGTDVRPYLRAGMGGVQVEFEQVDVYRFDADYAFTFQVGAGLLWLPARWLGLNAQALYNWGSTEDASLGADAAAYFNLSVPPIVGFNTEYFAFSGGLSFFFP
jgi:opacity protein-like surface antigen